MSEAYFRTGAAAKLLNVSSHHVRRLCETGLIEAEVTQGEHWKIPESEIRRLEKEGVPPIPQPLERREGNAHEEDMRESHGPAYDELGLLAEPSDTLVQTAEEVVRLKHEVEAIALRREREEALDWFRQREREAAEEREAEARRERNRIAAEQAEICRREREHNWLQHSLNAVPAEARDLGLELDIRKQVLAALADVRLDEPETIVRRVVDAAIARVLRPWGRGKEIAELAEKAPERLPWEARKWGQPTIWQTQCMQLARAAMETLPDTASASELQAAVNAAVEQVTREFHAHRAAETDKEMRAQVLLFAPIPAWVEGEDRKQLRSILEKAIAAHPAGTPRPQLVRTCNELLERFERAVKDQRNTAQAVTSATGKRPPDGSALGTTPLQVQRASESILGSQGANGTKPVSGRRPRAQSYCR